jgi:hypothetical protein
MASVQPPAAPDTLAGNGEHDSASAAVLAGLLGAEAERLLAAWRAVAARTGGLAPSESLALAERELRREAPPEH